MERAIMWAHKEKERGNLEITSIDMDAVELIQPQPFVEDDDDEDIDNLEDIDFDEIDFDFDDEDPGDHILHTEPMEYNDLTYYDLENRISDEHVEMESFKNMKVFYEEMMEAALIGKDTKWARDCYKMIKRLEEKIR